MSGSEIFGLSDGVWGNGRWVIVGQYGRVATSDDDGVTWTARTTGATRDLYGVTYGEDKFVVVGQYGTLLTSPDGIAWTSQDPGTPYTISDVTYGNGKFVAVNQFQLISSDDAVTWTVATNASGFGVAFGNNAFSSVGGYRWCSLPWCIDFGTGGFSSGGDNWTQRTVSGSILRGITFGNGQFVAVGDGGEILTARDGIGWSSAHSGVSSALGSVAAGAGSYLAFGDGDVTLVSTNGQTWAPIQLSQRSQRFNCVYGHGSFLALGSLGMVLQTSAQAFLFNLEASEPTLNSVRLKASVDPAGRPTIAWFEWGTFDNRNRTSAVQVADGLPVGIDHVLSGISLGQSYRFRVVASNSLGVVTSSNVTFSIGRPLAVTTQPTGLAGTNFVAEGQVTSTLLPTVAWFEWGADERYGNSSAREPVEKGAILAPISAVLSGLALNATYHFRLVASNAAGVSWGDDQTFGTAPPAGGALSFFGGEVALGGETIPVPWTFTCWVKRGSTTSRAASLLHGSGVNLLLESPSGSHCVAWRRSGFGVHDTGFVAPLDEWTHLAFVALSDGTVIYANGVQVSFVPDAAPLNLGTLGRANSSEGLVAGVDEVTVWRYARNIAWDPLALNKSLTGSELGLVAYWRFDEDGGSQAIDATLLGHTGTLSDGVVRVASTLPLIPVAAEPPTVVYQPTDYRTPLGSVAPFSVTAVGARPIRYQWQLEDSILVNATNSTLLISNVQLSSVGGYRAIISNPHGSVTSVVARLILATNALTRPLLGNVTRQDGRLRVQFEGAPTAWYTVRASSNLVDWMTLGVATEREPGRFEFFDYISSTEPARLYQVRSP